MRRLLIVPLVIFFCAPAVLVNAGVFSLTPVVTAAFDTDFNQLPTIPSSSQALGTPLIFEVTVVMDVISLGPGERSFANTGFNIVFGGDTEDADNAGWQPSARLGDPNSNLPGPFVPLWFANTDAGTPGDEIGILVSIAPGLSGEFDTRRNIGQVGTPASAYPRGDLGSIFVLWDGIGGAGADEDYLELSSILFQSADNAGVFGNMVAGADARIIFGGVPEPASLALIGMSLVGLGRRSGKGCIGSERD